MKTQSITTHYRGHDIVVTGYTPNGSADTYYTQHNDVAGSLYADTANDDQPKNDTQRAENTGPRIWATADAARKKAEQEIEDILGTADLDELGEATADLANPDSQYSTEYAAKRLADALASILTAGDLQANTILNAIHKSLTNRN